MTSPGRDPPEDEEEDRKRGGSGKESGTRVHRLNRLHDIATVMSGFCNSVFLPFMSE